MFKKRSMIKLLRYAPAGLVIILLWNCSFLGKRDRDQDISIEFDLQNEQGRYRGMGANVPISFYSRRMKPLQTLHDLGVKYIRVIRESDNWDDVLALRSASSRLGIKWIYSLQTIPSDFINEKNQLVDINGFADWWAEEVDELYYQDVPADYIELLETPDVSHNDSSIMSSDTYNRLIHAVREQLNIRNFQQVGIVGPGLSTSSISGDLETWYMGLDQSAYDALSFLTVQLWENQLESGDVASALSGLIRYLDHIDSRKPILISAYATSATEFGGMSYPDPNQYDAKGNLPEFKTFYYSASFSMPYGLRVYSNTLDLLKQRQVIPFIYQLFDAPADVKFKKQSWGLLDLDGVSKPAFTLLTNLLKRVPEDATIIPAVYDSYPGLNAMAFKNDQEVVLTLSNEETKTRSFQVQIKGVALVPEFLESTLLQSPEIHPTELGKRDLVVEQELELKLRFDTDNKSTFSVQLPGQSVLVAEFMLR